MTQVEVEIEVRILDPIRVVDPEGNFHQPATERRHEVQPRLDERTDLVVTDGMRCRRRVEASTRTRSLAASAMASSVFSCQAYCVCQVPTA